MFKIVVEVWSNVAEFDEQVMPPLRRYTMNHDDAGERRVLGEQCRNAFEGGQVIVTFPWDKDMVE